MIKDWTPPPNFKRDFEYEDPKHLRLKQMEKWRDEAIEWFNEAQEEIRGLKQTIRDLKEENARLSNK